MRAGFSPQLMPDGSVIGRLPVECNRDLMAYALAGDLAFDKNKTMPVGERFVKHVQYPILRARECYHQLDSRYFYEDGSHRAHDRGRGHAAMFIINSVLDLLCRGVPLGHKEAVEQRMWEMVGQNAELAWRNSASTFEVSVEPNSTFIKLRVWVSDNMGHNANMLDAFADALMAELPNILLKNRGAIWKVPQRAWDQQAAIEAMYHQLTTAWMNNDLQEALFAFLKTRPDTPREKESLNPGASVYPGRSEQTGEETGKKDAV